MQAMAMGSSNTTMQKLQAYDARVEVRSRQTSGCSVRLSELRKLRECEKVAAVCYRVRAGEAEFLLVQTRGSRRWTFPKGSTEAGLTHAQMAAIEAFEEAGVHGRMEEAAFAQYFSRRRSGGWSSANRMVVSAHLCEVLRLSSPKETGRNRTWFSVRDAKKKLREARSNEEGSEFARVVDKAVERIRRSSHESISVKAQCDTSVRNEWNRVEIESRIPECWADRLLPSRIQRFAEIQSFGLASDQAEQPTSDVASFGSFRQAGRSPKLLAAKKFKALGAGSRIQ
jgi:8-oxo-dGTP pyrophosphatase MutT (NUDIX family)